MKQYGSFKLKFQNATIAAKAAAIISEVNNPAWNKVLNVTANVILVNRDTQISWDDYQTLFWNICKAVIVAMPETEFTGSASYINLKMGFSVTENANYQNKLLTFETLMNEDVIEDVDVDELCCPTCGCPICFENQELVCKECGMEFTDDLFGSFDESLSTTIQYNYDNGEFIEL